MESCKMLINGEFVQAQSGQTRNIIDPGSGETIAQVPEAGAEDVARAIAAARAAFDSGPWRKTSAQERATDRKN
jgi:acyl-CoA reductase-like NAD-dependent aldehyde dehydrogenase